MVADADYGPSEIPWPALRKRSVDPAAALTLDCPIRNEDQDIFGTDLPTWTTDRVGLYLNATTR